MAAPRTDTWNPLVQSRTAQHCGCVSLPRTQGEVVSPEEKSCTLQAEPSGHSGHCSVRESWGLHEVGLQQAMGYR